MNVLRGVARSAAVLGVSVGLTACGTADPESTDSGADSETTEQRVVRTNEIDKISWLTGRWRMDQPDRTAYEVWERTSPTIMAGKSFTVRNDSTIFAEDLRIDQSLTGLTYILFPQAGTDNPELPFELTFLEDDSIVFLNPTIEFPNRIRYWQPTSDSLLVRVEGTQNGVPTFVDFSYIRD